MSLSPGDQMNQNLVDRMIAEGTLWSPGLIAAFRASPRHCFLKRVYIFQRKHNRWREIQLSEQKPEDLRIIYSDRALITKLSSSQPGPPLPISSSSQPSLMAQMLEDLKLIPELSVLEVGAGTGYNAALLAHVVGSGTVTSVDVDKDVLAQARDNLAVFSGRNIQFVHADGRGRLPEGPPFDRIMVTAATADLEPAWLDQLADRGLLLAPLALAPGLAYIVRGSVTDGVFHGRLTRAAYFMPLRSEDEAGTSETPSSFPVGQIRKMPAPWAGWFDRRRLRINWLGFSQALAFYGLLRGLSVHYRVMDNSSPAFGVSEKDRVCWFGQQEWHVSEDEGRDLGWTLWRAFLDAGGPWPTEFRLKASPDLTINPGRREKYIRQGPRCRQLWELMEPRDRIAWI